MTAHRTSRTGPRRGGRPVVWLAIVLIAALIASCGDSDSGGGGGGGGSTPPAPALADLIITSATVQRVNDQSCFGHALCLIVTVANVGTAGAEGFSDGCGTSSFGDPEPWGQYVLDGLIPAGSTITYRGDYHVLGPHLPATFTLFCEVDAADRVAESDESNNTYTITVTL